MATWGHVGRAGGHLHAAGNNAHFTLKALLMLTVLGFERGNISLTTPAMMERVRKMRRIIQADIGEQLERMTPDQGPRAAVHLAREAVKNGQIEENRARMTILKDMKKTVQENLSRELDAALDDGMLAGMFE